VHDRNLSYYYPKTFSGKAVLEALDLIEKISTTGLLLHRLSLGAQSVHRFAIRAPETAVAVHGSVNPTNWRNSYATCRNHSA
jgi:hypothetical protein